MSITARECTAIVGNSAQPFTGSGAHSAHSLPGDETRLERGLLSGWVWPYLLSVAGSLMVLSPRWRPWARKLRPVMTSVSA